MSQPAVQTTNLSKQFRLYPTPSARLKEWLSFGQLRGHTLFTALEDISLTVNKGEFVGVIGPNGSGKSTFLKLLSRVLTPTSGSFSVSGRVTSLLELGTGFQPDLTGRQNVVNSGRLLGFGDRFVQDRMDGIVAFAELDQYIDVPIKYYSSGMVVRLAFAMFAHVEPDVFIVDEALSVGDLAFSRKCYARLDEMRDKGCTLLLASHDLGAVRKYCQKAIFLNHGRCVFSGSAIEATDVYIAATSPGGMARGIGTAVPAVTGGVEIDDSELRSLRGTLPDALATIFDLESFRELASVQTARIGSGEVKMMALRIFDDQGKPRTTFVMGQTLSIHLLAQAHKDLTHTTVSIQMANRMGIIVWGTNHALLNAQVTPVRCGQWLHAVFNIRLDVYQDEYGFDVGWGDAGNEGHAFDRITSAATVTVVPSVHVEFMGLARLKCNSEVSTFPPRSAASARQPALATSKG